MKSGKTISVTHVTIRQSISLLLLKLVFLDAIAAAVFILFRPILFSAALLGSFPYIDIYAERFFLLAVGIKMLLSIYIILLWLNEYYEITPSLIRHKRGIFFIKMEQLSLNDIQSISVEQGLLGKILNFGTLSLFDWKWKKNEYLFDIHNPMKYVKIVESLLPGIDQEKNIIREHIMDEEEF